MIQSKEIHSLASETTSLKISSYADNILIYLTNPLSFPVSMLIIICLILEISHWAWMELKLKALIYNIAAVIPFTTNRQNQFTG